MIAAVENHTTVRIELFDEVIEPDFILNRGQVYQYLGQRTDGPSEFRAQPYHDQPYRPYHIQAPILPPDSSCLILI